MLCNGVKGLSALFSQVAVPDVLEAVKGADVLIFVIPHQFVNRICDTIKGHIKSDAVGMSLIKASPLSIEQGPDDISTNQKAAAVLCVCL